MKKLIPTLLHFFLAAPLISQTSFSVSINNTSGQNSITCNNPTLVLTASTTYTAGSVTYAWAFPNSGFATGSMVAVSSPGTYTLVGAVGTMTAMQTISIGANTTSPVSVINPTSQNITCNPNSITTVTASAVSPTANLLQYIISPNQGSFVANSNPLLFNPQMVGTFTYVLVDLNNGCKNTKTFTVNSAQGFPTYSVASSPPSFSLGCTTKSITTINILGASATNSNQVPNGGPITYTLIGPNTSTVTAPGLLSATASFTTNVAGNYTVIVKDNVSFCEARTAVTIISNTTSPNLSVSSSANYLSCSVNTLLLTGSSSNTSVNINWYLSVPPGTIQSQTLSATANLTVPPSSNPLYNYTLSIVDINNACKADSVVSVYQNIFPPTALATTGNNSPSSICGGLGIVITNISTSNVPSNSVFMPGGPVTSSWSGPSPHIPMQSSTYVAFAQGAYTMIATDQSNGCTSTTLVTINSATLQSFITPPQGAFTVACPGTVTLSPTLNTSSNVAFNYQWQYPPTATVSGANTASLVTNAPGAYTVSVSSPSAGCSASVALQVFACVGINEKNNTGFNFSIYPNPGNGLYKVEVSDFSGTVSVRVFDLTGRLVQEQKINEQHTIMDLRKEIPGIYFIQFDVPNRNVSTVKVIKQ